MVLYPTHIISKTLFTIQANVEIHSDNVVLERRRRAGRKPELKRERTIFQFIVWIKGNDLFLKRIGHFQKERSYTGGD